MTKRVFAGLGCLLVASCAQGDPQSEIEGPGKNTPPAPDGPGKLELSSRAPELVAGSYQRGGVTILFHAQNGAGQGRVALMRKDRSPLLEMIHGGSHMSLSILGSAVATTNAASNPTSENMTADGDPQAFSSLAKTPEFALLPALGPALERAGLEAAAFPATRTLLELASHAERLLAKQATIDPQAARRGACPAEHCPPGEHWDDQACQCVAPVDDPTGGGAPQICGSGYADLRGNPCRNDCRGMCGPKCSCWSWVCGNCGFHRGCYEHDLACDSCYARPYRVLDCAICLTPIAAFVAKAGC